MKFSRLHSSQSEQGLLQLVCVHVCVDDALICLNFSVLTLLAKIRLGSSTKGVIIFKSRWVGGQVVS